MAPAFDLPDTSSSGSPSPPPLDSAGSRWPVTAQAEPGFNEMSDLEATYQEATYQQNNITPNEAVDYFGSQLDRCNTNLDGSPAEKRAQIFKLLDSYYAYTRRRADQLHDRHSRHQSARKGSWQGGGSGDMDVDDVDDGDAVSSEDLRRAEEEAQTWDLLRRILPLRYRDPAALHPKGHDDAPARSRKQRWNEFMLSDSIARERKAVLEWLQNSASNGPAIDEVVSDLQQSAERGDILAHGWLHTRSKIKLQKSVNAYQGVLDPDNPGVAESHLGSKTLITQLDPDSITRQDRKLERQDEFFERAIWLGCFEMLRRGYSMTEIRDWCSARTELWRAAVIAPLPLSNPEDEDQADFDPRLLVLWNRTCFKVAQEGGTSDYDKAVYGLLSGDVDSVEKVCKSWDDILFANYSALLRMQFDSFLLKQIGEDGIKITRQLPASDVLQRSRNPNNVGKDLVSKLESDSRTSDESLRILKALQGAVVAGELDKHLHNQGLILSKHANQVQKSKLIPASFASIPNGVKLDKFFELSDHDSMRILAHVLIISTTLDQLSGSSSPGGFRDIQQEKEHIIAGYISYLRLANLEEMIPLYCSKLSGARVYETLSRNLIHIVDKETRARHISIMGKLDINVARFATAQPELYLKDVGEESLRCEVKGNFKLLQDGPATLKFGRIVKPDFFGADGEHIDAEDELIIRSLEWLLQVEGLLQETCTFVIRTYKYFLKRGRLNAARSLSDRVSGREIVRTKTSVPVRPPDEDSGAGWFEEFVNNLSQDVDADPAIDWEELTTTIRNLWELECLVNALDTIETLASVAGMTRDETTTSREIWTHAGQQIRLAKEYMQPVLKGWLLTSNYADNDFRDLRAAYIPETVMAFISCLHFIGTSLTRDNLLECMELAAVIAEKGSDVAQEFVRCGRMKELLEAFASCSKALAIWTSDKKTSQPSSKKMREMGWSRELWSVKP